MKDIFKEKKTEIIHCQLICTTRNVKGNSWNCISYIKLIISNLYSICITHRKSRSNWPYLGIILKSYVNFVTNHNVNCDYTMFLWICAVHSKSYTFSILFNPLNLSENRYCYSRFYRWGKWADWFKDLSKVRLLIYSGASLITQLVKNPPII